MKNNMNNMQTLKPIILFLSIALATPLFSTAYAKPVRILVRIKKHRHGMKNIKNQVKQDRKVWIVMVTDMLVTVCLVAMGKCSQPYLEFLEFHTGLTLKTVVSQTLNN